MPEEKNQNEEKLNQIIKAIGGISNRIDATEKRLDKIDKTGQASNPVFSITLGAISFLASFAYK